MLKLTKRLNLTAKFLPPILIGTLLALLAGSVLLVSGVKTSTQQQMELARQSLITEQESARNSQLKALHSKADSLGYFMAKTAPDLIIGYDFTSLKDYQAQAKQDPDVAYATYLKPDGSPLTDYKKPENVGEVIEKKYKIEAEDELIGYVLLGMSKSTVTTAIHASNKRINTAVEKIEENANGALQHFIAVMSADVVIILIIITIMVYVLFRLHVLTRLNQTRELITELADGHGDLTRRLPISSEDEVSQLCGSVNDFVAQLQDMIASIVTDVHTLMKESVRLLEYSSDLSVSADTQRIETTQVATAMNQMTATMQEITKSAGNAAAAAENADRGSAEGNHVVQATIQSIKELATEVNKASNAIDTVEADSDSIGKVLDVIKDIAEQTNLLALNAAIEAARAGEQGRGFAVVADEVRTLASRTQESTQEIEEMIERLQSGSMHAVSVMQQSSAKAEQTMEQATQAGSSLENIAQAISTINDMNTQIAAAAQQQSVVTEEMNKNVDTIHNFSENAADSAQKAAQTSNNLTSLSEHLSSLTSQFKI